ncbi:MAG: hypothetical protein ACJ8R9_33590 [Steroidobacteraceae bacterium]
MRKPNYQQARKQKELSRKARQQEKQQRKAADRTEVPEAGTQPGTLEGSQVAAEHAADDPIGSGV